MLFFRQTVNNVSVDGMDVVTFVPIVYGKISTENKVVVLPTAYSMYKDKSIGDKQGECMKNISFFAIVIVAVILLFCVVPNGQTNAEYLRIHIRADSNSQADQAIKYKVKAAVVDYLTPYIACADSKQKAVATVQSRLSGLQAVADSVLAAEGFTYKCHARLATEEFPTRCYNGFTLSEGIYDALILDLGSGSGDNWWCVVYPPLCFVGEETDGSDNIVYRSLIRKIIDDFASKQQNGK